MKAKELAELLMKNPEQEVYLEETNFDDWDCSVFYTPSEVVGLENTPSGYFIKYTPVNRDVHLKIPSETPVIGSLLIEMNIFGGYFPGDEANHVQTFIEEMVNYNRVHSYSSIYDDSFSFVNESGSSYDNSSGYILTPDDVIFKVLTSYDPNTWETFYTEMTYQEVFDYAHKNFEITKYEE